MEAAIDVPFQKNPHIHDDKPRIARSPCLWRILVGNGRNGNRPGATLKPSTDRRATLRAHIPRSEEIEMLRYRLFHVLVAAALVITLALTVREAFATSLVIAQTDAVTRCQDLPSRYSLHTETVNGFSVLYSEDGPTGVDGGLPELLNAYRTCSR
jgi:hypothetical protein